MGVYGTAAKPNKYDVVKDTATVQDKALQINSGLLVMACSPQFRKKLSQTKSHDLKRLIRSILAAPRERRALNLQFSSDLTSLQDLEGFISTTFSGEDALKEQSAMHLQNSIFNSAVESISMPN